MTKRNIAAADEVAEILRNAIIAGELKPRERLIEMELAEKYSVSRTPVREAIRNLSAAGLVKIEHYKGAVVADINMEEIRQIYEVRAYLEGKATLLAISHMNSAIFDQLDKLVEDMEKSIVNGDATAFTRCNDKFHLTIYSCCGNGIIIEIISDLLDKTVVFRRAASRSRRNIEQTNQTHRELLEAMRKGNGELAQEIAERHVSQFLLQNNYNETDIF